ncbi:MAG: alpha/beta fold hydrolase [bacterium]
MPNLLYTRIPWWLAVALSTVSAVCIWGFMSSRLVLSPPRDMNQVPPSRLGLSYHTIIFKSTDGLLLEGWFIGAESAKGTVILCHGYGTNKSDLLGFLPFLHDGGYNIFMFDFRAHGESPGSCSLGYYEANDIIGAVEYLKTRNDVDADKIGVIGVSMGGAAAFTAAARTPLIKAVISDSSFISFERTVTRFAKLFYRLPKFPLVHMSIKAVELRLGFKAEDADPLRYVSKIAPRAVFIIHGREDNRILPENAQLLFNAAKDPKELWIVPQADHLESRGLNPVEYEKRVIGFLDKYLAK